MGLRATMQTHWNAIGRWYGRHAKPCAARLREARGAKPRDIAHLAKVLGRELPPDVRAHLAMFGGGGRASLFEYSILPIDDIIRRWRGLEALRKKGTFARWEPREADARAEAVRFTWWHRGWMPLAEDGGGNLYCIDLAPAKRGTVGQVIKWEVHAGPVGPIAPSLLDYLADYRADITSGRFRYDADSGTFDELRPKARAAPALPMRPELQKIRSAAILIGAPKRVVAKLTEVAGTLDVPVLPPMTDARRKAIAAIERPTWKLAAAWPLTKAELAREVKRHVAPPVLPWQRQVYQGYSFAYRADGSTSHANLDRRDLRKLSFADLALNGAQLGNSLADGVDFSRAQLEHALLADLRAPRARFDGAKLRGADFSQSDLRGASFRNADLRGADFEEADVTDCDFTGAQRTRARHLKIR